MVVQMDPSDADAVRHLLTATQRFASRAEEARQRREIQEQGHRHRDDHRYRYSFDDFENYDEESDDERDFRDLSHYTRIDTVTGKVTELWLGIIDVYGVTSNNNGEDTKHWKLSERDWEWLLQLDQLEHFKTTGCGALPLRQLKELHHLKHISCSECGNIADDFDSVNNASDVGNISLDLPQVKSISLRCAFQPSPDGIKSLRAMFQFIHRNLTNLERITIWRLDRQQLRGQISSDTTAFQRKQYRRQLVETLLDELAGEFSKIRKTVKTIELNRCGLTSADFRRLLFEILPKNFPSMQRLSLSSNDIDQLPEIRKRASKTTHFSLGNENKMNDNEPSFVKKKLLFHRLRKSLQQIHLSNNPIMEFLGKNGDEHKQLLRDEDNAEDGNQQQQEPRYYDYDRRRQEEENAIVLRRFRRIGEFEKLRDLLHLFPKLSQLGYVSCVHNLMYSTTGDFILTKSPSATFDSNKSSRNGRGENNIASKGICPDVVPFHRYSKQLQRQIEYYLRINRGGRSLIDGGCCEYGNEDLGYDNRSGHDLIQSMALWPKILEWSYETSSSGCFRLPLPSSSRSNTVQDSRQEQSVGHLYDQPYVLRTHSSCNKNATALYYLLREGPALCGGEQRV